MARKRTLDGDGMLALARQGVADSLSSGVTTTADYSFSGAAAQAATELGLRAIVYLEVFAVDPAVAEEQYTRKRAVVDETELVRIGSRRMRPTRARRRLPVVPRPRDPGRHPPRRVGRRERLARARRRPSRRRAVQPWSPRQGRRAVATLEPVLGPDLLCAHCVEVDAARSLCSQTTACRSRTAHGRMPCSAAASRRSRTCGLQESRSGSAPTRPRRLPRSTSSRRCGGDLCRSRPRTPPRRPARAGCSRPGDDRGGARTANRRSGGYPDTREARRRDGRLARRKPLPPGGGSGGSRRLRRVARPSAGDDRRRQDPLPRTDGEDQWREVRNTASAARRRMLNPQPR